MARTLTLSLIAVAAQLAEGTSELRRVSISQGRYFDDLGRERHFRGVNVVYKDPPWLPHTDAFHANMSFVQDDAELLASLGVNALRLGVMWPGVVPEQRGVVDFAYLRKVKELISLAAESGLYTLADFHQDELHPRFCGEGAPDWWAREFGPVHDFPVPVQETPFGWSPPTRDQCYQHSSFSYIWTHDGAAAYQALYTHAAADFANYWAAVAGALADEPAVLGGDVFNEPFVGDVYNRPELRQNQVADLVNLQPFYELITRTVRAAGVPKEKFLFSYEPTWPVGTQDIHPDDLLPATSGFSSLPEEDSMYNFHYYSAPCSTNFTDYLDEKLLDAKRLRAAPFLSEFWLHGEDEQASQYMLELFQATESRLLSFAGWQYKSYSGSLPDGTCTGCGNSFFSDDGSLVEGLTSSLGRPFAGAVAGLTESADFDTGSRVFTLVYAVGDTGGAPTEIVVPGYWGRVNSEGDVQVEVEGDSGAKVTKKLHPGRTIVKGVEIQPWVKVHVRHSHAATRASTRVTVKVSYTLEAHTHRLRRPS